MCGARNDKAELAGLELKSAEEVGCWLVSYTLFARSINIVPGICFIKIYVRWFLTD